MAEVLSQSPIDSWNKQRVNNGSGCFVAYRQEAPGVWCNRDHLDLRASFYDSHGFSGDDGHRQRNVRAVGRVQQLCGGKGNNYNNGVVLIPGANDSDGFLLLQNRPRIKTQGNFLIMPTWSLNEYMDMDTDMV